MQGEGAANIVAHSKETDDLCKPGGARPSVKGLYIHQHKWLCRQREAGGWKAEQGSTLEPQKSHDKSAGHLSSGVRT